MSTTQGDESSASTDVPPGHHPPFRTATEANHGTDPENTYWRKKNLLSLDGGGMRGIWTLLVLGKLEEYIWHEEFRQAEVAGESEQDRKFHSFWPESYPENVSQLPDEHDNQWVQVDGVQVHVEIPIHRAILLCHYFDFIGGTSTGSLIAIMLGRFRMTAYDCLHEYKKMGHRIFRNPRLISQPNFGVSRPKYRTKDLEAALEEVTLNRCPMSTTGSKQTVKPTFPLNEGVCQIFVTTIRITKSLNGAKSERVFLIRSYNQQKRAGDIPKRITKPKTPMKAINNDPPTMIEVVQAARAAIAATAYFKKAKFPSWVGTEGQKYSFKDAGETHNNNPTSLGLDEIEELRGDHTIGAVLNVGTSRKEVDSSGTSLKAVVRRFIGRATSTRIVADNIERRNLDHYWRFNNEVGIDVDLDHCEPNHWWTKDEHRGVRTFEMINGNFLEWLSHRDNIKMLEECARTLVEIRRGRSTEKSQWEQFALGTQRYSCPLLSCGPTTFNNRNDFELHWKDKHRHEAMKEPDFEQWRYQGPPRNTR